jgi:hypothetical protein
MVFCVSKEKFHKNSFYILAAMEDSSEIVPDIKNKSSRWRYIITFGFLMIITVLVYFICTQEPKPNLISDKIIFEAASMKLNKAQAVITIY